MAKPLTTFTCDGRSGLEAIPRVDKHQRAGGARAKRLEISAQHQSAMILGVQCCSASDRLCYGACLTLHRICSCVLLRKPRPSGSSTTATPCTTPTIQLAATNFPLGRDSRDRCSLSAVTAAAAAARPRLICLACRPLFFFLGKPLGPDLAELGLLGDVPRIIDRLANVAPRHCLETKSRTRPQRTGMASC